MNKYELGILTDPEKTDADFQEIQKEIEDLITKNKGTIENVDIRGKRRLAYPIKKYQYAQYTFFVFNMPQEKLQTLERGLNLSQNVLRSLIVLHENFQTIAADERKSTAPSEKKPSAANAGTKNDKKEEPVKAEEKEPKTVAAEEPKSTDVEKESDKAEKEPAAKEEAEQPTPKEPKKDEKKKEATASGKKKSDSKESTKTQLEDLDKKLDEILEKEIS